jgi:chaperonin GroES
LFPTPFHADMVRLQIIKTRQTASHISGGLYIPDNAKERPNEGIVMAAGPGRIHPETGVQLGCPVVAGDSVIYGKYDGTEMKYNDMNHQLIKDDDVLLKYTGNDLKFENCEPVKDQVMIRLKGKDATSASGIIVNAVDNKDIRIDCGVVAKVGPGRQAGNGAVMPIQVRTISCSVVRTVAALEEVEVPAFQITGFLMPAFSGCVRMCDCLRD